MKKPVKMVKRKKPKRQNLDPLDPKKEIVFKGLKQSLEEAGYSVRREPLKRGSGWKVVSGSCETPKDQFIFVDRRLSQDDQSTFLLSRIRSLGVEVQKEVFETLPEPFQKALSSES